MLLILLDLIRDILKNYCVVELCNSFLMIQKRIKELIEHDNIQVKSLSREYYLLNN